MKYLALFLFFWSVLGAVAQICKHAFLKASQVFPLILQNVLWQLVHKKPMNRSFWSLLTHWWKQQHLLWIFCQIDLPCIIMIHAINHKTWLENFMSWKFMFICIYIYIYVYYLKCSMVSISNRVMEWCILRGGSRAAATSKMECFVIIIDGFQPLAIITKCSILDVAAAIDPLLILEW